MEIVPISSSYTLPSRTPTGSPVGRLRFCKKFRDGSRPALEELIDGFDGATPSLRLKKRIQLGPFVGTFSGLGRKLNACFSYNRRFRASVDRSVSGSWTRQLHPDFTITFWPEGIDESEAERNELLVHIHFDAKYRVEDIEELFGNAEDSESDEEEKRKSGKYKRQDMLKMHAYRDAIKRSQGAYILYPGGKNERTEFRCFHEVLPGLGAFSVAPDSSGAAKGFDVLSQFLDQVLAHLSNRTTSQERASFHLAESYMHKEESVKYDSLKLPELDVMNESSRALPPSEHIVVVASRILPEQLEWTLEHGQINVLLGSTPGACRVPPELASVRHVLLKTYAGKLVDGLFRIKEPGYMIFPANELISCRYPGVASGDIYAAFSIEADEIYAGKKWDEKVVAERIERFENRRKLRQTYLQNGLLVVPQVLSLQELLKAMR